MNEQTKQALIAKLQDDSVELQIGIINGIWTDTKYSALEAHIESSKHNLDLRIKPSTVSLPACELPKPETFELIAPLNIRAIDSTALPFMCASILSFKTESDAQAWADYLNSVLGCIDKE